MYPYSRYIAYPPDQPDNKVKIEAFGKRGAARKARMLLIHMGIIPPDVKPDALVVMEV